MAKPRYIPRIDERLANLSLILKRIEKLEIKNKQLLNYLASLDNETKGIENEKPIIN